MSLSELCIKGIVWFQLVIHLAESLKRKKKQLDPPDAVSIHNLFLQTILLISNRG